MEVKQLKVGTLENFVYVCWEPETGEGFIVDSCEMSEIKRELAGIRVRYIFLTHGHFDHSSGCEKLAETLGAKIVAYRDSKVFHHIGVSDGDELILGKIKIKILHTPGHTEDSICILADRKLFTGDTL
ncbi:MAG: MBL fold metallo-hydrolase, partial [Thermoplasmata archaeon]